jgi:hypothetical protein
MVRPSSEGRLAQPVISDASAATAHARIRHISSAFPLQRHLPMLTVGVRSAGSAGFTHAQIAQGEGAHICGDANALIGIVNPG